MAQALFEAFAGGVACAVDNQTAVAVQSLLDSQNVQTTAEAHVDDEDLFQCGKCKKQFTSLPAFMNHKQTRCTSLTASLQACAPDPVATTITSVQQFNTVATMAGVPSSQMTQTVVINDDLMTLTNLDPALHSQTVQMVTAPLSSHQTSGNISILSPSGSLVPLSTSNTLARAGLSVNQVTTPASGPAQLTVAVQGEKSPPNISKPSPTKAGRRSAQSNAAAGMNGGFGRTVKMRKEAKLALQEVDDNSSKKKLRCQYCDKRFAKNFDLQQHVRAHTGEKPFQCIVCGRAFAQKSNVKKHMATHKVWPTGTNSTLPKQPVPAMVLEPQDMEPVQHLGIQPEQMTQQMTQQITQQMTQQITQQQVAQHVTQHVTQHVVQQGLSPDKAENVSPNSDDGKVKVVIDSSYLCQYCPQKFETYFHLKSHMVQHKEQQVFKCVMKSCTCTFTDLDSFLEHTKTHEDEMTYRCHMCNKYFSSLCDLGVHQYSHSLYPNQGPKPGPRHFQCTKCMNKYSSPEALEHHMASSTHSYSCPHCDKVFACERYLRRHLPTHGTEGQFECPVCKKKFKTENYLKTHSFIHTGEKPFRCDECSACFNRKDQLKRHVLIHNMVKKHKCPFRSLTGCQKEFNRPDKLKAHIVTHSGIKPFKCKECGKGFSRKPHLHEHERGHKADYKFRCLKCLKGFFRPKLFNEHKCVPQRDGMESQVFRPRNRRKVGLPKKRMVSVTAQRSKDLRMAAQVQEVPQVCETVDNNPTTVFTVDNVDAVTEEKLEENKDIVKAQEAMLDHYVVHLTGPVTGGQSIQTFMPSCSQVLQNADRSSDNLQPITIIEAQPVHMTVSSSNANELQNTTNARLPMMTVTSGDAGESMIATQVVVTDTNTGEHTLVTCPTHLVEYGQ